MNSNTKATDSVARVNGSSRAPFLPSGRRRAISGDPDGHPEWDEQLTITVGTANADIVGATHKAIQAAVDYVAGFGGGTVHILPGTYRFRNAVYLRSGVRLVGHGSETILAKEAYRETTLAEDTDWFDQELTLSDPTGFEVGDGICLMTDRPLGSGEVFIRRTIVARKGNRVKLDREPRENMWMMQNTTVGSHFPILTAEYASSIVIENLTIDGNRDDNVLISGNYAACIWLQDTHNIVIRDVIGRNYNGDGIVWAISHDVLVERCQLHDNAGYGLHPGSGSQRAIVRDNSLERNRIGIYICWGVRDSLFERNTIRDCHQHGISVGHHDNHNCIRNNIVEGTGEVGILLRAERGKGYTPTGNRIIDNRVTNTGGEHGVAIDIEGVTHGNVIVRNRLEENRGAAQRIGIRLSADSGENEIAENAIDGFHAPTMNMGR